MPLLGAHAGAGARVCIHLTAALDHSYNICRLGLRTPLTAAGGGCRGYAVRLQPVGSMSVFVSPSADKQSVLAAAKLALLDAGIDQSCIQVRENGSKRALPFMTHSIYSVHLRLLLRPDHLRTTECNVILSVHCQVEETENTVAAQPYGAGSSGGGWEAGAAAATGGGGGEWGNGEWRSAGDAGVRAGAVVVAAEEEPHASTSGLWESASCESPAGQRSGAGGGSGGASGRRRLPSGTMTATTSTGGNGGGGQTAWPDDGHDEGPGFDGGGRGGAGERLPGVLLRPQAQGADDVPLLQSAVAGGGSAHDD